MLFKGTVENNRRRGRAFADVMLEIGAETNATTWLDRTMYYDMVPSGYVDLAIELEADRMRNALLDDVDLQREATVVLNELERNESNVGHLLYAELVAAAFHEHPYRNPPLGVRSDVLGLSTKCLRRHYDSYYQPENAVVFLVGQFDAAQARTTIEQHFGRLERSVYRHPHVHTTEQPQSGERTVVVKRPGEAAFVGMVFHTPAAFGQEHTLSNNELSELALKGTPSTDVSDSLDVLARILGGGDASRLGRAFVDTGVAVSASASNWGTRDPGLFQIFLKVRPGIDPLSVHDDLTQVLRTIANKGPSRDEVRGAQRQIAISHAFGNDGSLRLAQRLGELEAVGNWRLGEHYLQRISSVTAERVRDVAATYLQEDNRTVGWLIPRSPRTVSAVAGVRPTPDRPSPEKFSEPRLLPKPSLIRGKTFEERVVDGRLGNGIQWSYIQNTGSPIVHLRGRFNIALRDIRESPMLASVAAEMLSRGTTKRSQDTLQRDLNRLGIQRTYYTDDQRTLPYDPAAFRFSASCILPGLRRALRLLVEEIISPALSQSELDAAKARKLDCLTLAWSDSNWRAAQRFSQLAYARTDPNHLADIGELKASIERTSIGDVREFCERLVGSLPIVSGAGGAQEDTFAALFESSFGKLSLPSCTEAAVTSKGCEPIARREDIDIASKPNVDIILGRATSLVRSDPDYLAACVGNAILGSSTLGCRLGTLLRDVEGLTYSITSAFLSKSILPGPWCISLGVNPANVERAIGSALVVLREFQDKGPTEREILLHRNAIAGAHGVNLATCWGLAGVLEDMVYHGLPGDYVDTLPDRLASVTVDGVWGAAKRYFGDSHLIAVTAGTSIES